MEASSSSTQSQWAVWIPLFLAMTLAAQTIVVAYLGYKIDRGKEAVVDLEKQINSNLEKQIAASIGKAIAEERLKVGLADKKEDK